MFCMWQQGDIIKISFPSGCTVRMTRLVQNETDRLGREGRNLLLLLCGTHILLGGTIFIEVYREVISLSSYYLLPWQDSFRSKWRFFRRSFLIFSPLVSQNFMGIDLGGKEKKEEDFHGSFNFGNEKLPRDNSGKNASDTNVTILPFLLLLWAAGPRDG